MKPGDISSGISGESEFGKFNNKRLFNDGKYPMFSNGHNLVKIDEGTTVSYVQEPDNITPFYTFGYEHQGGENILFYTPPFKYNHGYLILEGGFTKLFNELDTDGTKRYILNIAAFTTQFAKRYVEIGENWKTDFKVTQFSFSIYESVKWTGFIKRTSNEFDGSRFLLYSYCPVRGKNQGTYVDVKIFIQGRYLDFSRGQDSQQTVKNG